MVGSKKQILFALIISQWLSAAAETPGQEDVQQTCLEEKKNVATDNKDLEMQPAEVPERSDSITPQLNQTELELKKIEAKANEKVSSHVFNARIRHELAEFLKNNALALCSLATSIIGLYINYHFSKRQTIVAECSFHHSLVKDCPPDMWDKFMKASVPLLQAENIPAMYTSFNQVNK